MWHNYEVFMLVLVFPCNNKTLQFCLGKKLFIPLLPSQPTFIPPSPLTNNFFGEEYRNYDTMSICLSVSQSVFLVSTTTTYIDTWMNLHLVKVYDLRMYMKENKLCQKTIKGVNYLWYPLWFDSSTESSPCPGSCIKASWWHKTIVPLLHCNCINVALGNKDIICIVSHPGQNSESTGMP